MMSYIWERRVLQDSTLPGATIRVAWALSISWANNRDPSIVEIAKLAGITKRTAITALSALKNRGYIRAEHKPKGRGHTNRFRPLFIDGASDMKGLEKSFWTVTPAGPRRDTA